MNIIEYAIPHDQGQEGFGYVYDKSTDTLHLTGGAFHWELMRDAPVNMNSDILFTGYVNQEDPGNPGIETLTRSINGLDVLKPKDEKRIEDALKGYLYKDPEYLNRTSASNIQQIFDAQGPHSWVKALDDNRVYPLTKPYPTDEQVADLISKLSRKNPRLTAYAKAFAYVDGRLYTDSGHPFILDTLSEKFGYDIQKLADYLNTTESAWGLLLPDGKIEWYSDVAHFPTSPEVRAAAERALRRTSNIYDPIEEDLDRHAFKNGEPRQSVVNFIKRLYGRALKQEYGIENAELFIDLYITGSLTTFQYSETSDCDVSVFPNYQRFAESFGENSSKTRKRLVALSIEHIDGTFLPGTTHPLQFFVVADGIERTDLYAPGLRSAWSIFDEMWVVPPEKERSHEVAAEFPDAYSRASSMATKMTDALDHDPESARELWKQVHKKRQLDQMAGLGDYSEGNIVYKWLLHEGLFDRIKNELHEYIAKTAGHLNIVPLEIAAVDDVRGYSGYPVVYSPSTKTAYIGPLGTHHADVYRALVENGTDISYDHQEENGTYQLNIWPPGDGVWRSTPNDYEVAWYWGDEDRDVNSQLIEWAKAQDNMWNKFAADGLEPVLLMEENPDRDYTSKDYIFIDHGDKLLIGDGNNWHMDLENDALEQGIISNLGGFAYGWGNDKIIQFYDPQPMPRRKIRVIQTLAEAGLLEDTEKALNEAEPARIFSAEEVDLEVVHIPEPVAYHGGGLPFVCFIPEKKIYIGDKSAFHYSLFKEMDHEHLQRNYLSDMEQMGNFFVGRTGESYQLEYPAYEPYVNDWGNHSPEFGLLKATFLARIKRFMENEGGDEFVQTEDEYNQEYEYNNEPSEELSTFAAAEGMTDEDEIRWGYNKATGEVKSVKAWGHDNVTHMDMASDWLGGDLSYDEMESQYEDLFFGYAYWDKENQEAVDIQPYSLDMQSEDYKLTPADWQHIQNQIDAAAPMYMG